MPTAFRPSWSSPHMPTRDPLTWAYHDDFVEILIKKDPTVAIRMLQTADIALSFARALVGMEFKSAHTMLTESLKSEYSPDKLQEELETMIQFHDNEREWPTAIQVVTGTDVSDMCNWLQRKDDDFGWTYVSIADRDYCYNEAVAVTVAHDQDRLAIRVIDWGRP